MAAILCLAQVLGSVRAGAPALSCRRSALSGRGAIHCRSVVTIHCVGKRRTSSSSEGFADAGYDEYAVRTRSQMQLTTVWHRTDVELLGAVERERAKRSAVICLDERGKLCTSIELSELLYASLEEGGCRLSFVIGGAEGLPAELRPHGGTAALGYLSLGKLTFTHQMARLILAEQIYRGARARARRRPRASLAATNAWLRAHLGLPGARLTCSLCLRCVAPPWPRALSHGALRRDGLICHATFRSRANPRWDAIPQGVRSGART
jgi:23S rRNA (pseudouridine1915-N3)-methyltransferase